MNAENHRPEPKRSSDLPGWAVVALILFTVVALPLACGTCGGLAARGYKMVQP